MSRQTMVMELYTIANDTSPEVIDHVIAEDTYNALIIFQERHGKEFMKDLYISQGFEVSQEIIDVLSVNH